MSPISSPTTTSWSTSELAPTQLGGLVRLVHPFPSILDGLVVGAVALVADAPILTAAALGASMTSLQFAIGALNDLHDAPRDVDRFPPKPIPAGHVAPDVARIVVVVASSVGLALAATFGSGLLAIAGLGLAIGFGYDLLAKGTRWSWLPLAVGIPILPIYGWYGATETVPGWAVVLVPAAAFAGAALAVANAYADHERDLASGTRTVATHLGPRRAVMTMAFAWAGAASIAIGWLLVRGADQGAITAVGGAFALIAYGVAVATGRLPLGPWRSESDTIRLEWAWRIQAIGAAFAAVTWLLAAVAIE